MLIPSIEKLKNGTHYRITARLEMGNNEPTPGEICVLNDGRVIGIDRGAEWLPCAIIGIMREEKLFLFTVPPLARNTRPLVYRLHKTEEEDAYHGVGSGVGDYERGALTTHFPEVFNASVLIGVGLEEKAWKELLKIDIRDWDKWSESEVGQKMNEEMKFGCQCELLLEKVG